MHKITTISKTTKRAKFIPAQVQKTERLISALCALQMQRNRMRKYKELIAAIDSGKVIDTTFNNWWRRDGYVTMHDKHLNIYLFIMEYYWTILAGMMADVISHRAASPEVNTTIKFPALKTA